MFAPSCRGSFSGSLPGVPARSGTDVVRTGGDNHRRQVHDSSAARRERCRVGVCRPRGRSLTPAVAAEAMAHACSRRVHRWLRTAESTPPGMAAADHRPASHSLDGRDGMSFGRHRFPTGYAAARVRQVWMAAPRQSPLRAAAAARDPRRSTPARSRTRVSRPGQCVQRETRRCAISAGFRVRDAPFQLRRAI